MLQIPSIVGINSASTAAYLSENNLPGTISDMEQQAILQSIDKDIHREYLYFSINLQENRITHCNGVARWLGYPDSDFSIEKYLKIIHPAHAPVQACYGMSFLELLKRNKLNLQFMQTICATTIALKHKNGRYLYFKRECAPFQLTDEKRMTEYLCRFSIVKKYNDENYHTRLYPGSTHNSAEERLLELVRQKFADQIGFSVQESRILNRYAQQKNCTSEMIAKAFKIEKSTVNTHNKRILKKAETFFQQKFDSAKEAAMFFKKMELI